MTALLLASLAALAVAAAYLAGYMLGYKDGRRANQLDQLTIDELARTLAPKDPS